MIENNYPFKMKKNHRNKWVYVEDKIRYPKIMTKRQKMFLSKMMSNNPYDRFSVNQLHFCLEIELKHNF